MKTMSKLKNENEILAMKAGILFCGDPNDPRGSQAVKRIPKSLIEGLAAIAINGISEDPEYGDPLFPRPFSF
jgi:hypothetical protein